jgi:hypothetical protein
MRAIALIIAAGFVLAACNFTASSGDEAAQPAETAALTLTASGEAQSIAPETDNENIQWAASVTRVDYLENQAPVTVKMFGMAGGDPAMNGLYTEIAFFQNPGEGWRVFRIGDFLDYRIVGTARGRVDLEIQESTMDEATGNIGSRTRHVIVTWTLGAEGEAPTSITVTPATAS